MGSPYAGGTANGAGAPSGSPYAGATANSGGSPSAPAKSGGGILGFAKKFGSGLASDLANAPGGVAHIVNTGAVQPWKNLFTTGHPYAHGQGQKIDKLTQQLAAQPDLMAESFAHPGRAPDQTFLNALALLTAGGSAAARVGAAGKALSGAGDLADAGAGARAGAAAKALITKPEPAPRLFDVGEKTVGLQPSANPAIRYLFQKPHDALVRKAIATEEPGPVTSLVRGYGTRRLGSSLAETRRYTTEMQQAPAQVLNKEGADLGDGPIASRLKPLVGKQVQPPADVQQAAMRLTSEQRTPEATIAQYQQLTNHVQQLRQAAKDAATPEERAPILKELEQLGKPADYAKEISKLQKVIDHGLVSVDDTRPAGQQVFIDGEKFPQLAAVDAKLAAGAGERDQILQRLGEMTPGGAKERVDAPARFEAGASYVKPTGARMGEESDALHRERARLATLEQQHAATLDKEAQWLSDTRNRNLGPLSPEDAQTRLDKLDKWYDETVKNAIPETSNYGGEISRREQLARNTANAAIGKGRARGANKIATVKDEEYANAEKVIHDLLASSSDAPNVQKARLLVQERQMLRDALTRRVEHQMGLGEGIPTAAAVRAGMHTPLEGSGAGVAHSDITLMPEAPAWQHASVGMPSNPFRNALVVLGHQIEGQRGRVQTMERQAAARVKPVGIVGGEGAREGRNYVPWYGAETRNAVGGVGRTPAPILGRIRKLVSRKRPLTGEAQLAARVPDNTTGLVARQMERAYRQASNDQFRRDISTAGSDTRQTNRDVLVNTQELLPTPRTAAELADARENPGKYAEPIPDEIRALFGQKRLTIDELVGAQNGLRAWQQHVFPGMKGGAEQAFQDSADIGERAPAGHKWVDRNLLGELAKPVPLPPGKFVKSLDTVNAAQTAATVYFKIGHVATRAGTNAVAALVQGSLNPLAMTKAYQLWNALEPLERVKALAAAGEGGIHAMPAEGLNAIARGARGGALWWSKHFDAPFRFLSLAYEARKAGFTGTDGFRELLDKLENQHGLNAAEAAKVDWVAKRANREAIAYNRLNEFERRYVRRAVWFYPWIKGASQFAINTMLEHPYKANVIGKLGQMGAQEQSDELGPLPSYERGLFKIGGSDSAPLTMNVGTVSPFETPAQVLDTIANINKPTESEQFSQYLTPALAGIARAVFNLDQYGRPVASKYGKAPKNAGLIKNFLAGFGSSTPELALYKAFTAKPEDQSTKMFQTNKRYGLEKFFGGSVVPRVMNKQVANKAAASDLLNAGR